MELPPHFTFPFHYAPHPLAVKAAREVKDYLATRTDWHDELQLGKMFGVLVGRDPEGGLGFLTAFSGNLGGRSVWSGFVPPIYDLQQPDSFFKREEAEISALNQRIAQAEDDADYKGYTDALTEAIRRQQEEREEMKAEMKRAKQERDRLRAAHADDKALMQELTRQSQFQKAELRRHDFNNRARIQELQERLIPYEESIHALKEERKQRSATLQGQLFAHYRILNARGEQTDLTTLFAQSIQALPPAGTGECAAPKLLQYAYQQGITPLCMAEFWWGPTLASGTALRRHGAFYPACQSKCGPILGFMLQGLDVEPNPLATAEGSLEPEIIYEDDDLMVVNKPSGLQSVPGKTDSDSVEAFIRRIRPEAEGPLIVHRLDQATSGLMLIAKRKCIHEQLQAQFLSRKIKKRYKAILEKEISQDKGEIHLPLAPDPSDRPRQQVSHTQGKPAHTTYEVEEKSEGETRIALYPHTGRTHQLRVHAAHPEGLHAPIRGDKLYGATHTEGRLCLHADRLEFRHPRTGEQMIFEISTPF
jgi:tRNA pseudouridine32 synthase/23S rRNA pseudouridine746 synthase